jgi:hypothetical protein
MQLKIRMPVSLVAPFFRPLFVRCIKPNMIKAPDTFNDELVLVQLNYTGSFLVLRFQTGP